MIALAPTKKLLHVHWLQTRSSEKQLYGNLYEMQFSFTFNFMFYFTVWFLSERGKKRELATRWKLKYFYRDVIIVNVIDYSCK